MNQTYYIAKLIMDEAKKRLKKNKNDTDINKYIHAVKIEVTNILMNQMKYTKKG